MAHHVLDVGRREVLPLLQHSCGFATCPAELLGAGVAMSRRVASGAVAFEGIFSCRSVGDACVGECPDAERQGQVLQAQHTAEEQLADQFQSLARNFAQLPAPQARTLKLAVPGIDKVLPQSTFDTRRVLQIHADGIARVVRNDSGRTPRERAYTLMAEMFLMQHSCHWFCRSKTIASARMLAQHQTHYEQALQAVSTETREAYLALVQGPALG